MNEAVGKKKGMMPWDILKFRWLEELVISPDGNHIAYTVKYIDKERNCYFSDIYLYDNGLGTSTILTNGKGLASAPSWSRNSKKLSYVGSSAEGIKLTVKTLETGEVKEIPITGKAPQQINWSPDGKKIVYSCWTRKKDYQNSESSRPEGVPSPNIKVIKGLRYKRDGLGYVDCDFSQIFILDLETAAVKQLTDDENDNTSPVWSWDGTKIAFSATARKQYTSLGYGQIRIYDSVSRKIEMMNESWKGASHSPQWRADDKAIVFAGHNAEPPVKTRMFYHLWHYDLETGKASELSAAIDQTIGNYAVADQRAGLSNITVKWPGGKGPIQFLLTEAGATYLYQSDEKGNCEAVVKEKGIVFEYLGSDNGAIAYGFSNPASPGELYYRSAEGKCKQVTELNPWLKDYQLSMPKEYWYDGLDGNKIHSWELRPPGFDASKKYPTIVYVHCSMFSWDFHQEFQCLANAGYVVFYFNQIGTTAGYGQDRTRASEGDQGGKDYKETMLGVDDVVSRPYVDKDRLGVTGGSCGGFMTNWIVGHTDRFTAAVTQRSISNEISCFGTSDIGPAMIEGETGTMDDSKKLSWKVVKKLWEQSPLAYVDNMKTPLLIIHSENDYRCPLGQAEELFAALKWRGQDVEMVIFEGESHGLSRMGKPGNRIERVIRILDWFKKYLGTEPE